MSIIFETIHGSRLYGLHHENSDHDRYVIFDDTRRAKQKFDGTNDVTRVGISDFLSKAFSGSHQSLEALFSPVKEWHDEHYRPLIEGAVVPAGGVRDKYMRTIKAFSLTDDFKRRRHALRLAIALRDMTVYGKFNPRLTEGEIMAINYVAGKYHQEEFYREAKRWTEVWDYGDVEVSA